MDGVKSIAHGGDFSWSMVSNIEVLGKRDL